jgi:hypothetical protein
VPSQRHRWRVRMRGYNNYQGYHLRKYEYDIRVREICTNLLP